MRKFTILDLLFATALIALNFAAIPTEASSSDATWPGLLYLTPTAITCLVHLRLSLKIASAIAVHYFTSAAWTFLHSVGLNLAINAYNRTNPSPGRNYQLAVYSNAWNDTTEMLAWGIAFAATYGAVCYVAVHASNAQVPIPAAVDRPDDG